MLLVAVVPPSTYASLSYTLPTLHVPRRALCTPGIDKRLHTPHFLQEQGKIGQSPKGVIVDASLTPAGC